MYLPFCQLHAHVIYNLATLSYYGVSFSSWGEFRSASYYGEGSGPIHMDNVNCTGDETSFFDCDYLDLNNHNCGHDEDTGVDCFM